MNICQRFLHQKDYLVAQTLTLTQGSTKRMLVVPRTNTPLTSPYADAGIMQ